MRMWNMLEGAIPYLAPSGYVSRVHDECNSCDACLEEGACPFRAIRKTDSEDHPSVDRLKCMGCGVCERICPQGALRLERDPERSEPLDVEALNRTLHDQKQR